jgi:energy-coupling factor transporter ATP-binding protein EcfA2
MSATPPPPPAPAPAPVPPATPPAPPRIKKISISGYRAFPPYKPKSLEIDLGDSGKNLLLYGENGSGKTSLFRALRDLFDTSPAARDFAAVRNIFRQDEDDAVVVSLTSGTPSEYRWEIDEPHPKTTGDSFHEFARTCLFLEYRDLLQTNFVHRTGAPDLFHLLVDVVLPELPAPTKPLKILRESMRVGIPHGRQTSNPVKRANKHASAMRDALVNHVPELVRETNRLLEQLQPLTKINLTPSGAITYRKANAVSERGYKGETLTLEVELNGKAVPEPQHFLNEARLTAIALAIYLAAARLTRSTRPGIMVLDDVLIGLDLSNRIPLLQLLQTEFSDWQVLLLTHDATWYDMAASLLDAEKWSFQRLHLGREPGTGHERPVHVSEKTYLETAEGFLLHGDFPAAGVYLRSTFEALLRDFSEEKRLHVPFKRELRELTSEDLWPGVKNWAPRNNGASLISPALADEIEFCRRFILNPLCHDAHGRPNKTEAELALAALKQLKATTKASTDWRRDRDQTHGKGEAISASWHMALCDWMLKRNPALPIIEIAMAVRAALAVGLESFNQRHRVTITYTADGYATLSLRWEAAKWADLNATQPAFVALLEGNSTWLLKEAPADADWAAATAGSVKDIFDALRGTTTGNAIRCVLSSW